MLYGEEAEDQYAHRDCSCVDFAKYDGRVDFCDALQITAAQARFGLVQCKFVFNIHDIYTCKTLYALKSSSESNAAIPSIPGCAEPKRTRSARPVCSE